jgi:MscS family membrane protein
VISSLRIIYLEFIHRLHAFLTAAFFILMLIPVGAGADQSLHPLAPPDTTSPKATLNSFLDEMNKAVSAHNAGERELSITYVDRAAHCLNLEKVPEGIRAYKKKYAAIYLKEVLDRIDLPDNIPDVKTLDKEKLKGWTIPYTEITIAEGKPTPSERRFLFTSDTVERAEEFFKKVKNLPYKPGAKGALLNELTSSAGPFFPSTRAIRIPEWAEVHFFGQPIWQWFGLILYFVITICAAFLSYKYLHQALAFIDKKLNLNLKDSVSGLVLPVILMTAPEPSLSLLTFYLHLRNVDIYSTIALASLLVSYAGRIWLYAAILNRVAQILIYLSKSEPHGMHAQLIHFVFNVITGLVVIGASVNLGSHLGLPTYSLVTGLGVGGLAVALAGQQALSNIIGTVAILLDRPFKLGDTIMLEGGERGTVEEIGLRSTRIKKPEGMLVSIPNANLANMKIVNESAPESAIQINIPVKTDYDVSIGDVEQILLKAAQNCEWVLPLPEPSVKILHLENSTLQFQLILWIINSEVKAAATDQIYRIMCADLKANNVKPG